MFRQRLHERSFKSTRLHEFETASKSMRFGSVYREPFSPENPSRDGISERCTTFHIHYFESNNANFAPSSNRIQIDAVSLFTRQMKPHRFENAPLLAAVSNRRGFDNSLGRCRVNGRCNCIVIDAVTNETAFV